MDNLKKKVLNKLKTPYRLFCVSALLLCVCENVPEHCRDGFPAINPSTQFCNQDNQPWDRCGGQTYNTSTHECSGGSIRLKGSGNNTTYTLTVESNPTAGGTTNPASSQTNITAGTKVNISATAANGYKFSNWTVSGSGGTIADPGDASTTVTVNGNVTVTANFTQNSVTPATVTLTVNRNPAAGGMVKVNNADYSSPVSVNSGTAVDITVTVAVSYQFAGWTVSAGAASIANANSANTTVTLAGNATITANFTSTSGGGGSYESVVIRGKTWMKKNLNVETANSWCYDDDPANCAKYGRLYTWAAAKSACPTGWKLPSRDDWDHLAESVGGTKSSNYGTYHDWLDAGKKLKSESGWNSGGNGTDDVGFSALPGGDRYTDGNFNNASYYGSWWTATEYDSGNAYFRFMNYGLDSVYEFYFDKGYGLSVRCVKD